MHSPILYTFVVSVSPISDVKSIVAVFPCVVVSMVGSVAVSVVDSSFSSIVSFSVVEPIFDSELESSVSSSVILASFFDTSFSRVEI